MNDNIRMEIIWQGDDYFEISLTCCNKMISATTNIYVTDEIINDLELSINQLVRNTKEMAIWKVGERGNDSIPCVELKFFQHDLHGRILIECFMEIDDGGSFDKHNCCFYVNTELGLLQRFGLNVAFLKTKEKRASISLLD